ncbi:MAG: type II toxin-antitoxin system VapC family toxin [Bacteroidota bacterium]
MNGRRLLIDTNIALYVLNGDETVAKILDGKEVFVSFITQLELLGYQGITQEESLVIHTFLDNCQIIDINESIKEITIKIKKSKTVKLPDAIIAASAMSLNIPLITADKGFEKVNELTLILYDL